MVVLCIALSSFAGNPYRTYSIRFIEEKNDLYNKEMTLKFTETKIFYFERDAYWNHKYTGIIRDSNGFCYHRFILPSTGSVVLVSDSKIMKIDNLFYYIIILNGQYHYAL